MTIEKPLLGSDGIRGAASTSAAHITEQNDVNTNADGMQLSGVVKRGRRNIRPAISSQCPAKTSETKADDDVHPEIKLEPIDVADAGGVSPATAGNDHANEGRISGISKSVRDKGACELFKKQPFVDHSYFSICIQKERRDDAKELGAEFGSSRTSGWKYGLDQDMDEDDKQILSIVIRIQAGPVPIPKKLYIPMVRVPKSAALLEAMTNVDFEGEVAPKADENRSNATNGLFTLAVNRVAD